jgi:hypothetical protein
MDVTEAAKYYQMSAAQGDPCGEFGYAGCLEHGNGVPRNVTDAANYYKMVADKSCETRPVIYAYLLQHCCRLETVPSDAGTGAKLGNFDSGLRFDSESLERELIRYFASMTTRDSHGTVHQWAQILHLMSGDMKAAP